MDFLLEDSAMKNFWLTIVVLSLGLFVSNVTFATVNWQTVYEADFSTDLCWTTEAPAKMYWDGTRQQYHLERSRAGQDKEYTYVKIPAVEIQSPTCNSETTYSPYLSYKLEFDLQVVKSDWAGEVVFGLGDENLSWDKVANWSVNYSHGEGGYGATVQYRSDSEAGSFPGGYDFIYELNEWYHNVLIYSSTTESLMWEVTKISDGKVVLNEWAADVGVFTGIDRLFSGSKGVLYPGGTGEAWLDNVVLYAAPCVPEPTTLLLLGLGGLALLRRKRGYGA